VPALDIGAAVPALDIIDNLCFSLLQKSQRKNRRTSSVASR